MDTDLCCVLTRFQFRSTPHLLSMRRRYRRVAADAERLEVPGLRQSVLLLESPTACFSLSIWDGLPLLSANVPSHIHAANSIFGSLAHDDAGPQLWSTTWRLTSMSNNRNWPGCDLSDAITPDGTQRLRA
jgi:hypothetical protein